jgi:hypothetical protein
VKETNQQTLHREYLKSPVWKAKRLEALAFYGPTCRRCGQYGNDVHHKTYERVGGGELMDDLEILCRDCHEGHHMAERTCRSKSGPKQINRSALFRLLSKRQKMILMERFSIARQGDLYLKLTFAESVDSLIYDAQRLLGVSGSYRGVSNKYKRGSKDFSLFLKKSIDGVASDGSLSSPV